MFNRSTLIFLSAVRQSISALQKLKRPHKYSNQTCNFVGETDIYVSRQQRILTAQRKSKYVFRRRYTLYLQLNRFRLLLFSFFFPLRNAAARVFEQ